MNDETEVIPASEEQEEELDLDLDTDNGEEGENQEETVEEIKARLAKAEELAANYKIRAEKAEKAPKVAKKPEPDMSSSDLYALMQANVPQDDITEVQEYAKLKNISVKEALSSNVVRTILADNAEKRRTAEVTATGTARRSSGKVSADTLLEKAKQGQMPESEEDMNRLINAKLGVST